MSSLMFANVDAVNRSALHFFCMKVQDHGDYSTQYILVLDLAKGSMRVGESLSINTNTSVAEFAFWVKKKGYNRRMTLNTSSPYKRAPASS